jgi:hypothetical protein
MKSAAGVLFLASLLAAIASSPTGGDAPPVSGDHDQGRAFVAAARRGDEHAVRKALERDSGLVHATDALGMTALDWAATREHWHIFRQLLAKGAPVDVIGGDGGTVLHRVAHHDRADMVRSLVEAGADLGVQNRWGRAPLHVAARRGCSRVAALLLDLGADPGVTTREGWTPLHVAYRSGQPELVDLLLARGADPLRPDTSGKLPADYSFVRPAGVSLEPARLHEYQGLFDVDEHFHFRVWVAEARLWLQDFGADELYATGPDSFYCRAEPWRVCFHRDESGTVSGIEVRFLRRAVRGTKRSHPQYVGSHVCGGCHGGQERGAPYIPWLRSRHAAAYWRLATDWALTLARSRPHFRGIENPREDERCLLCHVTAVQDPDALFARTFHARQGVGCESCHGPGSLYVDAAVMSDRDAFLAAGGRLPDERTCRDCHRNPDNFRFEEWWPKIAHGTPPAPPSQQGVHE